VKDLQLGLAHHRLTAILKAFRLFFVLLDCPTTLSEFNTTSTPTTNSSPASMRVAARQDDGFSRVVDTRLNDRLEASRTSALGPTPVVQLAQLSARKPTFTRSSIHGEAHSDFPAQLVG
jgi:hypothetical protein